jgi:hypothetical protein
MEKARTKWSKILQPAILTVLQGKGLERKKALPMTSAFGYFWRLKSN